MCDQYQRNKKNQQEGKDFFSAVTLTFIIDLCMISSRIHQSKFNGIFSVRKFTPNKSWLPRHDWYCSSLVDRGRISLAWLCGRDLQMKNRIEELRFWQFRLDPAVSWHLVYSGSHRIACPCLDMQDFWCEFSHCEFHPWNGILLKL